MFKKLEIQGWRQFDNVDIEFHPRLTILTGANGSGKTTMLNLLNRHFGWQSRFVATPTQDKKTGVLKYFADLWKKLIEKKPPDTKNFSIGTIVYENGEQNVLTIARNVGNVYNIEFTNRQNVKGLVIPSHGQSYQYQQVTTIPTSPIEKQAAFDKYSNSVRDRYYGGHDKTANFFLKETLISLATFGYGNEVVTKNEQAIQTFEEFQSILKKVLPPKLGFEKISIRIPEIVLETKSGNFSIDAVSGGIAAIIDLAWQIYMSDDKETPFVVTIDEPENHLHPEMQKTLLPNFIDAFPKTQFIVATHNPFIITSTQDSNVYVLNFNDESKVQSIYLEKIEKSGTANEILRDVLGIETTKPDWAEKKIDEIIEKFAKIGINKDNIAQFKSELKEVGLEKYIPTSVGNLIEKKKK